MKSLYYRIFHIVITHDGGIILAEEFYRCILSLTDYYLQWNSIDEFCLWQIITTLWAIWQRPQYWKETLQTSQGGTLHHTQGRQLLYDSNRGRILQTKKGEHLITVRPHTGVGETWLPQQLYNLPVDVFSFYTGLRPILTKQHFLPPLNCDVSLNWYLVRIGSRSVQYKSVALSMHFSDTVLCTHRCVT